MADSRLFTYVDALSHTKDVSVLKEERFRKDYVPFVVNRALSYHQDACLAAQYMNERPALDVTGQFAFYLNTLGARKRMAKWHKSTVSDETRLVAQYYGCSLRHAKALVPLHTSAQLKTIAVALDTGGTTKVKRVNSHDSS